MNTRVNKNMQKKENIRFESARLAHLSLSICADANVCVQRHVDVSYLGKENVHHLSYEHLFVNVEQKKIERKRNAREKLMGDDTGDKRAYIN